jgi:hypothetical protein
VKHITLSRSAERIIFTIVLVFIFIALVIAVNTLMPVNAEGAEDGLNIGVDWKGAFRPATLDMIAGRNPYEQSVYNPPWAFIPLIPVAFLSPSLGASVMFVLGLFMFGLAAYRFGARPWLILLFVLSQPVLGNSANGNLDWMVALGCTLPPQFGLFLVLSKPQLGAGIALFWLIEAWRKGQWREVLRVFAPVGAAFVISFLLYGPYLLAPSMVNNEWNLSLWPVGVAIGAPLIVYAIRSRKPDLAISSSPFLAPYISGHGWSIALFGLLRHPMECTAAILALWVIRFF